MTRDDIIRMVRESGDIFTDKRGREEFAFDSYGIERFAALVAAAEREACAKAATDVAELAASGDQTSLGKHAEFVSSFISRKIAARGQA